MKNNLAKNSTDSHDQLLKHLKSFYKKMGPFGDLPIMLHWSDSAKLTKVFQLKIKNDEDFFNLILSFDEKFKKLNHEKIWLKKEDMIISMSVYDIYHTLINHLKNSDYEDQLFNSQEVSFVGPTGPFMDITMVELVTQSLFKEFLYFNILKNKVPQRSFRLHTQGEVVVQFGRDLEQFSKVDVCQITDNGVLFSCKDDLVLENLSHGPLVKFHIDTKNIYKLMEGKAHKVSNSENLFTPTCELQFFTTEYEKVIKTLSYDSGMSGKFYLFVRYVHMKESDLPSIFKQFVEQVKDVVNQAAS